MSLSLVLGIGVLCFLLLYFAFNVEKEHTLLRFILIVVALFMLVLIPKTNIENNNYCDVVIQNQTENATTNTTYYEYKYFCETNSNTTPNIFYKSYLTFLGIFAVYIIVYFSKEALEFVGSILRKR